jgi:hypothetical protein
LSIGSSLLSLFGVVVLLEILFGHFTLNDHQTRVDERLFEELALEHSDKIFNTNVFTRGAFDNAAVSLNLLLLGQGLLRVSLTLFS